MRKSPQYKEGPEAGENFERALAAVFRAPKKKAGTKPARAKARKKHGSDKG
jgi:hypothetical protein